MALPGSGTLSISQFEGEFSGKANPLQAWGTNVTNFRNLNFYRGKYRYNQASFTYGYFPSGAISISDFYSIEGNCVCDCACDCACDCVCDCGGGGDGQGGP